ncbi:MAG: hypothetical protein VKP72_01730 [bacterium]|nr:hypothetical protein [bacterium]
MSDRMDAIAVVFGYLACTIPCVGLLIWILRLRSDQVGLFAVALWLQLVPVGLLYWPLGLPGVVLLAAALWRCVRRNHRFRSSGLGNPEVERLWSRETVGAWLALGLACEQKGLAWLFLEVTGHRGWDLLWHVLLPVSLIGWLAIALGIHLERRTFGSRHPATISGGG